MIRVETRIIFIYVVFAAVLCLFICPAYLFAQVGKHPYVPPTVVSLVVNGSNKSHLDSALRRLKFLHQRKKVLVGEVYVTNSVGLRRGEELSERDKKTIADQSRWPKGLTKRLASRRNNSIFDEIGVNTPKVIMTERVLKRYGLEGSPTWIVRHRGRNYIYEGYSDVSKLFSKDGNFLGAPR